LLARLSEFSAHTTDDKEKPMKDFNLLLILIACYGQISLAQPYNGTAWRDSAQIILGKIQCELYDKGGSGIAYYDTDAVNNGSGKLNPNDGSFLNTFRMQEGVDISYTKERGIDNNEFNVVEPLMDQLYVGWTEPGEWIKYCVDIQKAGTYEVALIRLMPMAKYLFR
jgi:hypothetical protein